MKRIKSTGKISVLLVAVMLTTAISGCRKSETEGASVNKEGDFVFGRDPVSFSWYADYEQILANEWANGSIVEEWVKENKKINIKYIPPAGGAGQKLSIMIASMDLPDVIQLPRGQTVEKMVQSKLLEPLDTYAEKYPYMKDDLGSSIVNMLRSSDGAFYQVPNWANSSGSANGNSCWMVNKKVYDQLGRPPLETFDDLYNYLNKVKVNYPDMIPLEAGTSFAFLTYAYCGFKEDAVITDFLRFCVWQGNELVSIFKDESFKNAMLLASKYFREGLISADALIRTKDQLEERIRSGRIAVMAGDTGIAGDTRADMQNVAGSDWEIIWPIHKKGLNGSKIMLNNYGKLGWNTNVITKNAKNPEGIYAYLDWVYGPEGQATFTYGPKGLYWDELNEQTYPILKPEYFTKEPEEIAKDLRGNGSGSRLGNTAWIDGCARYVFNISPVEKRSWVKEQQFNIVWKTSKEASEYEAVVPPLSTEEGIIYQSIADLYTEAKAKFIFAKDDAEVLNLIDNLVKEADGLGMERLLKVMTQKLQENLRKLNK